MDKMIETFDLTKRYRGGVIGIEKLSLSVFEGEIFGFLGSNGAGKTTTIRVLVNLLFPTSGSACIFGKDVVKYHLDICRDTGYIPSSVRPHKQMTGHDFLNYMGRLSSNGKVEYHYRRYLLDQFAFSERDLGRKLKDYSSGMARKIALIQTFQHRPRLVIMDEPTEGLDPVMQETFYELLKEYRDDGGTVFVSSHHLREVELVCDRAGIIRNGRLAAVETIKDLKKHTSRTIHVEFNGKIAGDQLHCPAWKIETLTTGNNDETGDENTSLTALLTGDIDTIIKLLARFPVKDMSLPTPSLQDVFLHYYREEESGEEDSKKVSEKVNHE